MPRIIEGLRERILSEFEKLMIEDGSDITIRNLAGRAGVAVGTIYNYFPDKDDLLRALFQAEWSRTLNRIGEELKAPAGDEERAGRLVSVVYDDSEIIAGSMHRRKKLMGGRGRGKGPPYPFRPEGWLWLNEAFFPLWEEYFALNREKADRLTVLLAASIPRLIQQFPEEREGNIRFVQKMVLSNIRGDI
jgi:AcrR family transcriptional regulator